MVSSRERYLQRKYGITEADYQALLDWASGRCWICFKPPKNRRLHVEHDHKTGRVRGLTCWRCNTLLQHANDDPAILERAAEYLETDEASRILGKDDDAEV